MPEPLAYRLYQLVWLGIDWLYPPRCAGCDAAGQRWCETCQAAVEKLDGAVCTCCGQPQSAGDGLCVRCQTSPPAFAALRSWGVYRGPLRQAIHALKYGRNLTLGDVLARPLIALLRGLRWPIDTIVPVPLGVQRLRQRGYNQADVLARPLALALGLDYRPAAVRRQRETASQVGLNLRQRHENVHGAFLADSKLAAGRHILVVDDVATTGATLESCAIGLLRAGAAVVYALTLARADFSTSKPA